MNEVTKLYENAGLSNMWVERYNDGYYEHERYYNSYKEMINNMMKVNDWTLTEAQEVAKRECKKEHPPFTAEKQLELYKYLCKPFLITTRYYFDEFSITAENTFEWKTMTKASVTGKTYEECIAKLINTLWQDLTEEERKQIKEILE